MISHFHYSSNKPPYFFRIQLSFLLSICHLFDFEFRSIFPKNCQKYRLINFYEGKLGLKQFLSFRQEEFAIFIVSALIKCFQTDPIT